ncbi:cytochrome P450 [Streptomyces sp. KL118A]|uniref:cytochrome P450 n=1 Tax=Streptomyces sp. KL118A TaxID=3045153 RepID=UPI00278C6D5D|nr:cytochrome P450 [Streptomyces sp. KL118A]
MRIPGPEPSDDGGVGAISAAGGLHLHQLRLHAEYGPVVRFQLPGAGFAVSVSNPLLLEDTARLDERPAQLFAFLEPLCEAGNLQVIGAEEHGPWRRVLLEVLAGRPSHERHFGEFVALVEALADRWDPGRGSDGDGDGIGSPVFLQKDLTALSLRMICAYALGGADDGVVEPEKAVDAFEVVLTEYLGRTGRVAEGEEGEEDQGMKRAELALSYLRDTVDRVVAAHGENGENGQSDRSERSDRSDLIGALLAAGTSPARIRDTVMVTMLAAHHTTGVAVSWTLHLLGRHPEVAERVTEELDRVLGDRSAPAYGDLRELTYLDMVLKESMRLYPPGPYGARETTEAMVLGAGGADGAYEIPAGTTVFYPFWAVHMNPDHWPEPERFLPERFTPEAVARRPRLAHVPFGFGPRSCEGAGLATVEAQLMLAVLLKRFRFRAVEGHEVTPVERFVLWAAEDIPMTVTPRASGRGPTG